MPTPLPISSRVTLMAAALLLSAAILTLYSHSFGHNFLFDEQNLIVTNSDIQSLDRLPRVFQTSYFHSDRRAPLWNEYYRPLVSATFALNFHFSKLDPFFYNVTNVLIHAAVSVCLFLLSWRLAGDAVAAFLAALVFGIHPVQTQAVSYLASRGDLMAGFFVLFALLAFAKDRPAWALVAYFLALLSKENALLLPLYLACFDWAQGKDAKAIFKKVMPFLIVAASFLIFRNFFCPVPAPPPVDWKAAVWRFLSVSIPLAWYLEALFFPAPFKHSLAIPFVQDFSNPFVWLTLVIVVVSLAAWWTAFKKHGAVFFGLSLFFLAFMPYSQIVPFNAPWAEQYWYVPLMGLAVLLALFLKGVLYGPSRVLKSVVFALYAIGALFWVFRTWQRNEIFNNETVYYQELSRSESPYAYVGGQQLAKAAMYHGRWDKAFAWLDVANAKRPLDPVTYNLWGLLHSEKGEYTKALGYFKKAHRYGQGDAKYPVNTANTHVQLGHYREAIRSYREALALSPGAFSAYRGLATAYELNGEPKKAAKVLKQGLACIEGSVLQAKLWLSLAGLSCRQGWDAEFEEALHVLETRYAHVDWKGSVKELIAKQSAHLAELKAKAK